MMLLFRILACVCLVILLTTDEAASQNIPEHNNIIAPNSLLLAKKKNIVFLTSSTHTGNLGGLSGADKICQDLAHSAGLPGKYLAWLSDSDMSPASRFVHSKLPYVLPDGVQIAANWSDLTDGFIEVPINTDENTKMYPTGRVWSHTQIDGTPYDRDHNCDDWTAAVPSPPALDLTMSGDLHGTGGNWTDGSIAECNDNLRFYCFQQ